MVKRFCTDDTPEMDSKLRFGLYLRAIREQRRMTQEQFAELIERSVDTVSNMERGVSLPSFETLGRIADKLGLPIKTFTDVLDNDSGDAERISLEATLAELGRQLPKEDLRTAVDILKVLRQHSSRPVP